MSYWWDNCRRGLSNSGDRHRIPCTSGIRCLSPEFPLALRRPRLQLFCALSWLFLCSCSTTKDPATIQMAVGGQTQFIYLPLTLASQLGYFKDEGLTVNIS